MTKTDTEKAKAKADKGEKKKSALQKAKETPPTQRSPAQKAMIMRSNLKAQHKELNKCEGEAIVARFIAKALKMRREGHKKFDLVALD